MCVCRERDSEIERERVWQMVHRFCWRPTVLVVARWLEGSLVVVRFVLCRVVLPGVHARSAT